MVDGRESTLQRVACKAPERVGMDKVGTGSW